MIVEGFLASKSSKQMVIVGPTTPFFDAEVKPLLEGQNRAHYLGPIYERDVVFAMRRNAFAYVHGHTVGGTNPSLLEAMASANYVVARDVEFNREVVEDRGSYFDTADQLARTLEQIEQRPIEELRAAGLNGRERIAREFNWDRIIDDYAKVLTEAASAGAGARAR
jgi:glycosyltransferase involved in cell wall biosynthesis